MRAKLGEKTKQQVSCAAEMFSSATLIVGALKTSEQVLPGGGLHAFCPPALHLDYHWKDNAACQTVQSIRW